MHFIYFFINSIDLLNIFALFVYFITAHSGQMLHGENLFYFFFMYFHCFSCHFQLFFIFSPFAFHPFISFNQRIIHGFSGTAMRCIFVFFFFLSFLGVNYTHMRNYVYAYNILFILYLRMAVSA